MRDAGPPRRHPSPRPSTAKLLPAFAAVYVIWGSTYLAIPIDQDEPPLHDGRGVRFIIAGALLLSSGNGSVVWAEQWVPSGLAALLIGMVPPLDGASWTGSRGRESGPAPCWLEGRSGAYSGVGLLASASGFGTGSRQGLVGGMAILAGGISWAVGSIRTWALGLPAHPALGTAMQLLVGGAFLLVDRLVTGEIGRLDPAAFSVRSVLAMSYLVVFGSLFPGHPDARGGPGPSDRRARYRLRDVVATLQCGRRAHLRWSRPVQDWTAALNCLPIVFEGRVPV